MMKARSSLYVRLILSYCSLLREYILQSIIKEIHSQYISQYSNHMLLHRFYKKFTNIGHYAIIIRCNNSAKSV